MLTSMDERERSAIKYVKVEAHLAVQLHTVDVTRKFLTRNAVTGIGHTSKNMQGVYKIMLLITEGYEAFNGYVFTKPMADLYNRTCRETMMAIEIAGSEPSTMSQQAVEKAKDNQVRMFKSIIGVV
jgi:hypothetical protein